MNKRRAVAEQKVSLELQRWILAQAAAGHASEVMLRAMLASGWREDTAGQALAGTLASHRAEQARLEIVPPATLVPAPELGVAQSSVWAGDREVSVLMTFELPPMVVFGGFLSDEECDELVALARARLARSETVVGATGASEVNQARTSDGMFFERAEHEVCERIEARIAALLNWPVQNGEGLQVLHYGPGAEYQPHYDYFDPAHPGSASLLARGGQRVATLVMYLNTPGKGGETAFPDIKHEVAAVKGNAVFFSYDRPHPMTSSLHGGSPVLEGEKWVATKWLREREFV